MNGRNLLLWLMGCLLVAVDASASETLQRYLLAVGANAGGPDRVSLKYAVSDAERFADIMVSMGGVDPASRIVLQEPDHDAILAALSDLAARIAAASSAGRTEVLVYYSGHADATGLRIGAEHMSYGDLRSRIEAIPAAVRITVLDACASGTITRLKGGERRPPFLVDVSSDMEGYAFLTSSAENEAAQESDAIGASFFTHYLVSGLRGAADVSGDGRVSLTEAYQFAFNETLARTTETMGGPQHPSYQMNLAGTGDVVMTDVRRMSAGLVLEKSLYGRLYVRDHDEHLVAELYKRGGRPLVLGLEAGGYKIHLERDAELFVARVELGLEDMLVLSSQHFEAAERTPAVARGTGEWPPRPGFLGPLVGRSRIGFLLGKNQTGVGGQITTSGAVSTQIGSDDLLLGLGYGRWIREDLAIGAAILVLEGELDSEVGATVVSEITGLLSLRVGLQKYLPPSLLRTPVRPFFSAGVGALLGSEEKSEVGGGQVSHSASTMGAFGAELGLGVDFLVAHRLMLGTKMAYFLVTDFPEPLAGKRNYSSLEFAVSVSWLFGRGFEG